MTNSIIYSSDGGNLYLYNTQLCFSMLIHPELKKIHNKDMDASPYYIEKYKYLKKHNFFGKAPIIDFNIDFNENVIKENIIKTRQIVFETTDHCNLACEYCSLGELYNFSKNKKSNINTDSAINFLKYIFDIKEPKSQLTISFFGGEPLVNGSFIKKIVKEAIFLNKDKKLELKFSMTTNATLIHKYISFLVENNFHLLISLDGDKECHSYRKYANKENNSFDIVIDNIDEIQNKYPTYFMYNIEFNAVLHNKNSIYKIYDFIYNRYHKIPRISALNTDHINPHKKYLFKKIYHSRIDSENEFQNSKSKLSSIMHDQTIIYKESKKYLEDYSINYYIFNLLDLIYDQINITPTGTCYPFQRKMFLNTNNNLLPCEKVNYKYSLGEVGNKVIIDIHKIAKKYSFYYHYFKDICQQCYSRKNCSICILTLEKLGTEKFICPGFQNQKTFESKLNRIFSFLEKNPNDTFNNKLLSNIYE